jgi:hypothetical protein
VGGGGFGGLVLAGVLLGGFGRHSGGDGWNLGRSRRRFVAEVGAVVLARAGLRPAVGSSVAVEAGIAIWAASFALGVAPTVVRAGFGAGFRWPAAGEGLAGEGCAAVPAFGEGIEVGGRGEGDGCGWGGCGRWRLVAALAVLRERLAGQDDGLACGCSIGIGIGPGDGAGGARSLARIDTVEIGLGREAAGDALRPVGTLI